MSALPAGPSGVSASALPPSPLLPPSALLGVLALLALGAAGLLLGLVFGLASYADVRALSRLPYHEGGFQRLPLACSAGAWLGFRLGLGLLLLALSALTIWLWRRPAGHPGRREARLLTQETRAALPALAHSLRTLSRPQAGLALALLALLLAVRTYFLVTFPVDGDEVRSYFSFSGPGFRAALGFYPQPNNHVLYNLLGAAFHALSPGLTGTIRLPTFLLGAGGTVLVFAALLRFVPYAVALGTVGLFSFTPQALFHSFVGRGYLLQALLAALALLAVLGLGYRRTRQRLYWAVLVAASALGLLTIPTFVYVVVPLFAGLALHLGRQRRFAELRLALSAGLLTALTAALLYTPILLLSGPARLLRNVYVQPNLSLAYLKLRLLGPAAPAPVLLVAALLAGLALLGALLWASRRAAPGSDVRRSAPWLLALLLGPLPIMLLQRVLPPGRVFTYLPFFGLLGLLLLLDYSWPARWPRRWLTVGCALAIVGLGAFQTHRTWRQSQTLGTRPAQVQAAFGFLTRRGPVRVFCNQDHYQVFLYYESLRHGGLRALATTFQPAATYDYWVLARDEPHPPLPAALRLRYQDDFVRIYEPATAPRLL